MTIQEYLNLDSNLLEAIYDNLYEHFNVNACQTTKWFFKAREAAGVADASHLVPERPRDWV